MVATDASWGDSPLLIEILEGVAIYNSAQSVLLLMRLSSHAFLFFCFIFL